MLQIHNSLSKKKEPFVPLNEGKVGMYVCGMTVYDYCHLGHARLMVVFDTVYRHLVARGFNVTYVRNVTDIDDKIIERANEAGQDYRELTKHFIAEMHADEESLGIARPTFEPLATDNIDHMINLIKVLIEREHAYHADNGDVYYAVNSFEGYGKLSGRKLEDLRAGERVAVDEGKRDPLDFVMWKSVKPNEPHWDSPWGPGRPGWHIECSAMAADRLGEQFDIHGGGMDLQFPHHENEIAQSEAAHDKTFANYWMHNGFVRLDDEKMSKSLGNFFTIREVLKEFNGEEIRFLYNSSHYRSPLNYSDAQLEKARGGLRRLYTALRGHVQGSGINPREGAQTTPDGLSGEWVERYNEQMDDDFNTAEAVATLFDLASELNRQSEAGADNCHHLAITLQHLGQRMGVLHSDPEAYLRRGSAAQGDSAEVDEARIEQLIGDRLTAREQKDWTASDSIRDELKAMGVILEDKGGKTSWRRE